MGKTVHPRVGIIASGDDFFGREKEQRDFWNRIENSNLMLLAPRRVGKTSLLRRLQEESLSHGFQTVFLDVASASDELAFVKLLYEAVLETQKAEWFFEQAKQSPIAKFLKRVQKIRGWGFEIDLAGNKAVDWRELGKTLVEILQKLEGRWLIEIDELPLFLLTLRQLENNASNQRTSAFLYWFRNCLRQPYHETLRWTLAGSIGLDTVVDRLKLTGAINDFVGFPLGAFDNGIADHFLQALTEGQKAYNQNIDFPAETRAYAIERISWPIPYYVQILFAELCELHDDKVHDDKAKPLSPADVDMAFDRLLIPEHRNYFGHWKNRLEPELGTLESSYAVDLLNASCRAPNGASLEVLAQALGRRIHDPNERDEGLHYLLNVLQNDGYGVKEGGRFRFRSPLLREYWLRHVVP